MSKTNGHSSVNVETLFIKKAKFKAFHLDLFNYIKLLIMYLENNGTRTNSILEQAAFSFDFIDNFNKVPSFMIYISGLPQAIFNFILTDTTFSKQKFLTDTLTAFIRKV